MWKAGNPPLAAELTPDALAGGALDHDSTVSAPVFVSDPGIKRRGTHMRMSKDARRICRIVRTVLRFRAAARPGGIGRDLIDLVHGRLRIARLGLSVSPRHHLFFLERLDLADSLRRFAGADFAVDGGGSIYVHVAGITARVTTEEELFILNEIFVSQCYDFAHPGSVVVCDIGMNVGLASLFFASRPDVYAVEAFEPFAVTYQEALANLDLNPDLARKIRPHHSGIAGETGCVDAHYCYDVKGRMGLHGLGGGAEAVAVPLPTTKECIALQSAVEVVDTISQAYPGKDIVAKVDCEGSEYEILDALRRADRLGLIRAFMIEWHHRGPAELITTLQRAGYVTFSLPAADRVSGMVYAVRTG